MQNVVRAPPGGINAIPALLPALIVRAAKSPEAVGETAEPSYSRHHTCRR